jgi:hypothetical protein
MAFLPEQSVWSEGIYQLEIQDGPAGGPDGIDNVPLKQLADRTRFLFEGQNSIIAEMPFGYEIPFDIEPTALELATWRCLPLRGQIIQISLYQRLCDRKYVGDAANATADWWYKCDPDGTRNPNGAYMRVLDKRGLFTRADGQNSKYTMANDTPYDGMEIGSFLGDAIRNIYGHFFYDDPGMAVVAPVVSGVFSAYAYNNVYSVQGHGSPSPGYGIVAFNASNVVPTALENRVASTSAYFCIKY